MCNYTCWFDKCPGCSNPTAVLVQNSPHNIPEGSRDRPCGPPRRSERRDLTRTPAPRCSLSPSHDPSKSARARADLLQTERDTHELPSAFYPNAETLSTFTLGLGRYIDSGSILRFSECIATPLESILSLDFNSR